MTKKIISAHHKHLYTCLTFPRLNLEVHARKTRKSNFLPFTTKGIILLSRKKTMTILVVRNRTRKPIMRLRSHPSTRIMTMRNTKKKTTKMPSSTMEMTEMKTMNCNLTKIVKKKRTTRTKKKKNRKMKITA